jgi:hypothetical protein
LVVTEMSCAGDALTNDDAKKAAARKREISPELAANIRCEVKRRREGGI